MERSLAKRNAGKGARTRISLRSIRATNDATAPSAPGGSLDHVEMRRRPDIGIDVRAVFGDHHGGRHLLTLGARQFALGHRSEPDIGIQPDLMTRVAGAHGTAARLRHVADEKAAPAG